MRMLTPLAFCLGILLFTGCSEGNNQKPTGTLSLEMTDSPIDQPGISQAVVTVAEVQIDGESWEGFEGPVTFDLLAYQEGNTRLLGVSDIETNSYNSLELILDLETDAGGEQPGCYILTDDMTKHNLAPAGQSTMTVEVPESGFTVQSDTETKVIIDLDLRKSVAESFGESDFAFVTSVEMRNAARAVTAESSGSISGTCDDELMTSDKIVVYAYATGTFNRQTEMQGQGSSEIMFANAVTSSSVGINDEYTLSFLPEGNYELVFASYEETPDGSLALNGTLELNTLLDLDPGNINVESNAETKVDVSVTGLLPL